VTPLLFIGAGAFSEQVEIVCDINQEAPKYDVLGILDDDTALHGTQIGGVPVLGGMEAVREYGGTQLVMGIGTNRSRHTLAEVEARLDLPAERYETLIHPGAKVYSSATIGAGAIIHAGCVIGNGTEIGPLAKIIWNAVIGENNYIGRGTSICPNATTCAGVKIGAYSFVASAAAIADDTNVGPMARIGMGTMVTRDVAPGCFVFGNPPRIIEKEAVPVPLEQAWANKAAGR